MFPFTQLLRLLRPKPKVQSPTKFVRIAAREKGDITRIYEGGLAPLIYTASWHLSVRKLRPTEIVVWQEPESDREIIDAIYRAERRSADLATWDTLLGSPWTHYLELHFVVHASKVQRTLISRPLRFAFEGFDSDSLAGATVDALAKFLMQQDDRMFLLRHDQYAQMFWLQFIQAYLKMRSR